MTGGKKIRKPRKEKGLVKAQIQGKSLTTDAGLSVQREGTIGKEGPEKMGGEIGDNVRKKTTLSKSFDATGKSESRGNKGRGKRGGLKAIRC